jgi:hypothetical protein
MANLCFNLWLTFFCINNGIAKLNTDPGLGSRLPQPYLIRVLLKLNELNKMAEGDKKMKREDYEIKEQNGPRNGGDGSST